MPFENTLNPDFDTLKETIDQDIEHLKSKLEREGRKTRSRLVRMGEKSGRIVKDNSSTSSDANLSPRSKMTKEQKRSQVLFLKRLENDGHKVTIGEEEQELIEGVAGEGQESRVRLEDAMVSDVAGKQMEKKGAEGEKKELYKILLGTIHKSVEAEKALTTYTQ